MRKTSSQLGTRVASAILSICVVSGVLTVVAPAASADTLVRHTYNYTGGTETFTVPGGVTSIGVNLIGGQGGIGGGDSQGSPQPGGFAGQVQGTISVTPGQVLTIAVGGGGVAGVSSQGNAQGGTGGQNPLAGYDGGTGGNAGNAGSSGGGGGGGAASVIRIGSVDIVAAGAGGNGGNGQYLPIVGRHAEDHFVARPDATTTVGRNGLKPEDVAGHTVDGGGSGAGGAGAQGGERGDDQYGGATATEWFGLGGFPGSNEVAGFGGLSGSYLHYDGNSASGSVTLTYNVGVPDPPRSVVGAAGNNLIDVYWLAPVSEGGAPITDYVVRYSTSPSGPWTTFNDGVSTTRRATITGLSNGTPYYLQVSAVNAIGESLPSAQSPFPVTPTATPDPKPILLYAYGGDSLAFLEWSDLASPGATVTDYQVEYATNVGGPWTTFSHAPSTAQQMSVTGLTNGTPYLFRVAAVTTAGQDPFSNAAAATPLGAPTAPVITSIVPLSSNLKVNFTAPTNTGGSPITGYEYQLDGGAWITATQGASPLVIGGLDNGHTYSVAVRAITAASSGLASAPESGTPFGLPGAVPGLAATPATSSVTLTWDAADDNGSTITSYNIVAWSAATEGSIRKSQTVSGATRTVTMTGLATGPQYFTIEATNSAGTGPRTAQRVLAIVGGTPPAAPTVATSTASGNEVNLSWTHGAEGTSPINGYTIRYVSDDGDNILLSNSSTADTSRTVTVPTFEPYRIEITERSAAGQGATTTVRPPMAATGTATVSSDVADVDLTGSANANNSSTQFYFQIADSLAGLTTAPLVSASPDSSSSTGDLSIALDGYDIDPASTYYFRAVARSGVMTSYGTTESFTTDSLVQLTVTPKSYDGQPIGDSIVTQPAGLAVAEVWTGINGTVYGPTSAAPSEAGDYRVVATITESGYSGSTSYDITISRKSQVVSFDEDIDNDAIVGEKLNLATSSTSGIPAVLSIIDGDGTVCKLSGNDVTMIGPGNCMIRATQSGSRNYEAATSVMGISVTADPSSGSSGTGDTDGAKDTDSPSTSNGSTNRTGTEGTAGSKVKAATGTADPSAPASKLAFTGASLLRLLLPASLMTIAGTVLVLADPNRLRKRSRRVS